MGARLSCFTAEHREDGEDERCGNVSWFLVYFEGPTPKNKLRIKANQSNHQSPKEMEMKSDVMASPMKEG